MHIINCNSHYFNKKISFYAAAFYFSKCKSIQKFHHIDEVIFLQKRDIQGIKVKVLDRETAGKAHRAKIKIHMGEYGAKSTVSSLKSAKDFQHFVH